MQVRFSAGQTFAIALAAVAAVLLVPLGVEAATNALSSKGNRRVAVSKKGVLAVGVKGKPKVAVPDGVAVTNKPSVAVPDGVAVPGGVAVTNKPSVAVPDGVAVTNRVGATVRPDVENTFNKADSRFGFGSIKILDLEPASATRSPR